MPMPKEFAGRFVRRKLLTKRPACQLHLVTDKILGNREMLLKVFPPQTDVNDEATEAFNLETELLRKASHGVLAPIVFSGFEEGHFFLVMEYIEGQNLHTYLDEEGGRLVVGHAVQLFLDLASAISEIHQVGAVHGRLDKEAVAFKGSEPRVIGYYPFSVEQLLSKEKLAKRVGINSLYVAPEMSAVSTSDPRGDIFSLSVILFETLSARKPYSEAALKSTRSSSPDISQINSEVPPELSTIIQRGLSLDVEQRYQSLDEMVEAVKPTQKRSYNPYGGEVSVDPSKVLPEGEKVSGRLISPLIFTAISVLFSLGIIGLVLLAES